MLAGVPVLAILPESIRLEMDKHFDYYSTHAVAYLELGQDPTEKMRALVFDQNERNRQIELGYAYAEETLGQRDGQNAHRLASIVTGSLGAS